MQNFWKSSSNEQQLTYQGGPFQSLGGGGSGGGSGPSGPQSLPLPPRSYTDIAQQQAFETQGVNQQIQEQFQTQDYLQQALYAAQKKAHANAQQVKSALVSQPINSEDLIRSNLKFQNMRQLQARQGQVPSVAVKEAGGHFLLTDQQMDSAHDSRSELRFQQPRSAQSSPSDMRSSSVPLQNQQQLLFNGHSQYIGVPQIRMHQSHSLDHNAGAVLAAHAQYIHPQLLPQLQAHFAAVQKASDIGSTPQKFHPAIVRPQVSLSTSGQDLSLPNRSLVNAHGAAAADGIPASGVIGKASPNMHVGVQLNSNIAHLQHSVPQPDARGVVSSNRSSNAAASSVPVMSSKPSFAMSASQKTDTGSAMHFTSERSQLQHLEQPQESPRPMISSHDSPIPNPFVVHQGIHHQQSQAQRFGFTRQQLMVLKSQILAFRRLKRGERMLPQEVLRSIGPPPLALQQYPQVMDPTAIERATSLNPFEIQMKKGKAGVEKASGLSSACTASGKVNGNVEEARVNAERTEISSMQQTHVDNEVSGTGTAFMKQEETPITSNVEPNCAPVQSTQSEQSVKDESSLIKDSATPTTPNTPTNVPVVVPNGPEKNILATSHPQKASPVTRRYRGPLFDFPAVGKKVEGTILASSQGNVWGGPISFSYDVRQLLLEEGIRLIDKRRAEKLNALDVWLASGLQKKQFSAEIILKLRIEQRKLRLMELQSRIREEVEQQQQEIMALSERGYRKFVRLCERQRADLARQVLLSQKTTRERQLKSLFQWRKRILEAHWASRDARTTRNRGIAKYHERMLREFSKRRDEDRNKRMDALKNNDVDTYREMLKQQQQQTQMAGDAGERYEVLSSFLTQTEDYLYKLGGKISAVKNQQEREEAAYAAASAARAQGLSEEEVKTAAEKAIEEVDTRNELLNLTPASVSKYYSLAHAVNERIVRQPSMLHAGILRDYQLVGLQWMLSLYNNRLNGILADEMGLGKTVQVMALIAYLMEFKCNNGPHLIIVPNAVIVNWKSELSRWLPSVSCIFYVGGKEQRAKMYTQEVCALKFNVLVTTYEFVMRDRARLSKVEWKYIIIDEAQRMKDRESRLARDLDRFRCLRRLLLTGTPLQNDLQELWSLLNLLLPEVFDNSKSFHDWFSTPFQKDGSSQSQEDDWLETEKKVIVIHRLHQILEPFMLRRRVEDVEGSLPPKVPVVLRCKMSALQAAIYDWIKATGTIRLDPEYEAVRVAGGNGKKQMRAYTPLQNKCMELRKVCNHPFLNYPSCGDHFNDFAVRSCGKLWILDRILTKLHRTDHRVLLFSTMTKLLDILEEHLQRRGFKYRRIDGTTSLEMREMAIMDFNRPGSDCFVFLLSIRAAGRGLNLQSADTVVIYDPDPNPKNEEQAVARAHRIGQKREVRVIYMEAVVEAITSYQKEDELRCGGTIDVDDEMAGKDRYMGSVESLVRNTIQQHKIDMADEVINAGRFDQRTSQEERRLTLETLLRDEDRYQERVHDVPTMQEVNRMIARSDEEVELFDQMDEEYDWPGEMLQHQQIHEWLRVGSREVNAAIAAMSRQASKRGAVETFGTREKEERLLQEPYDEFRGKKSNSESGASVKRKNWNLVEDKKIEIEKEYEEGEEQEQNLEKNLLSDEEEGEIREDLYEEESEVRSTAEQEEGEISEEEGQVESAQDNEVTRQRKNQDNVLGEVQEQGQEVASESSHDDEEDDELGRNEGDVTHTPPASQKFGSLSALDKRPLIQPVVEELEEGEIAASGSSPFDVQVSESWAQDREEGEEQQAIQPRTKRKRSVRHHRRRQLDKLDESTSINLHDRSMQPSGLYQLPQQSSFGHERQAFALHQQYYHQLDRQVYELDDRQAHRFEDEAEGIMQSSHWRSDQWGPPMKRRHLLETILSNRPSEIFTLPQPPQLSQPRTVLKHSKMAGFLEQDENVNEVVRENTNSKMRTGSSPSCGGGGRMPENTQKKCKNVLQKLQGAVNKDGRQIATLFELPTRNELPGYYRVIANPIDACTIEQHLDRFEYGSVLDFAADVQLMLYNATRYYNSTEVKADARRLQALFFQRMGLKFPDVDFSSVKIRSLATLSQPMTPSGSSPWQQNNQVGLGRSQVETSVVVMDQSTARNVSIAEENIFKFSQKEGKKVVKDSKVRFVEQVVDREKTKIEEALEPEDPDVGIRHPVDFVFRKKKRKDREKGLKKVRMIGAENNNIIAVGNKVSTGGVGVNDGNRGVRGHGVCVKGIRVPAPQKVQQGSSQPGNSKASKMSGSMGAEQWFTPVKKLRTDGGKRRPSHL